jgi:hypothetical protein
MEYTLLEENKQYKATPKGGVNTNHYPPIKRMVVIKVDKDKDVVSYSETSIINGTKQELNNYTYELINVPNGGGNEEKRRNQKDVPEKHTKNNYTILF